MVPVYLIPSRRQAEGRIDLVPGYEEPALFILLHKAQPLQGLHIIKDIAVLPVKFLRQGVDAHMPHRVQGIEQFEPLRGQVFEQCGKILEIEPFDRLLRSPAAVELAGDFSRLGKEFLVGLDPNLDISFHYCPVNS